MKNLIGEQHGAMIIVTHDMNLARQMDRCLYLVSGKLTRNPAGGKKPPKKSPAVCGGFFLFITALDAKKPLPRCKKRILLRRKPDLRRKTGQAFR